MVTVIEKTVMEGTNKDPNLLSYVNIASTQANADNVDKLVEDAENYKEMVLKMKDTLLK